MNGPREPAPRSSAGLIHQPTGPSALSQGKGLSRVPRASKSRYSGRRVGGRGPASRQGPCFPVTGRVLDSPDPPFSRSPLGKAAPRPPRQPVAPERTQASPSWAWEPGRALGQSRWPGPRDGDLAAAQPPTAPRRPSTHPHAPRLPLTASPWRERSASLLRAFAIPRGAGRRGESAHRRPDPGRRPPQPRAPRDLAPEALLRGLDVRAASPGGEPRRSRPAKDRPASPRSDASRHGALPSGAARAGPARRAAEPTPPASCLRRRGALGPSPLCPRRGLPPGPLLPGRRGGSSGVPGRLHLSGALRPGRLGGWDGALCPAVLQRAQGGARVSPPGAGCSGGLRGAASEPSQLLTAPLPVARENTLSAAPLPFRGSRRPPWSARGGRRDSRGVSRRPAGLGAPRARQTRLRSRSLAVRPRRPPFLF